MKILLASPTYDGSVRKEYMQSVMRLTDYFRQAGIAWDIVLEPATLLHVSRSVMASKALVDEETTHLLFVDTDMGFSVDAVRQLIDAKKEVIGCAYPYRTIPLHDPVPAKDGQTFRQAISEAVPYAVRFASDVKNVDVADGICEVAGIGTGLLLVSRQALEALRDSPKMKRYKTSFPFSQWYANSHYWGFFDHIVMDDAWVGEDYSFCHRWTHHCKGRIYAVVGREIMHVGPTPVLGRYSDRLRTGKL